MPNSSSSTAAADHPSLAIRSGGSRRTTSLAAVLSTLLRCTPKPAGPSKENVEFISKKEYKAEAEPPSENECSVCLSAFVDGEEISELNGCKHLFHVNCIHMWLRSHSTCPICRISLPVNRRKRRRPPITDDDDDFRQGLPDATSLI